MPSEVVRLLARFAGYVATFVCLHVMSAVAIAHSCAPLVPRIDSGAGFIPFGANEQVLARGGNSGPAWEWAVGTDTESSQKSQGSLDWVSGRVYSWRLVNSGSGSAVLEIRDAGNLRLSLKFPAGMDAGNALELRVGINPSIGPEITIDARLTSLNGYSVLGTLSQSGTRSESGQALYYYFSQMAQGFTAEGTVSLTFPKKRPTGSRVQFTVRAGTIPCSLSGNPPTVSITAPAANSVFSAPATIAVAADAQDSDGAITQVAFFANGNLIGAATASPFTIQWSNVSAGEYSLTGVATDTDGSQTSSAAVPITVGAGHALYFIYADHLNTPRLISDATQIAVWRWDQQEPFGNNSVNEGPDGNSIGLSFPQRFPGQYYDVETLLHYNHFRDYDPGLGRFGASDPIGLKGGLNTYLYVFASPLTLSDPKGLEVEIGVRPFYPIELPLVRHCFVRFNRSNSDTLSFSNEGVTPDPNPSVATYSSTAGPENDPCVRNKMTQCGKWALLTNNCCDCVAFALESCGLKKEGPWPNRPIPVGPAPTFSCVDEGLCTSP